MFIEPAKEMTLKKHNIVNRDIRYLVFLSYAPFVRNDEGFFDVIILICDESAQCTVYSVVFAGFHFNWHDGKTVIVVDKIIDLALASIIIVKQSVSVSNQLAGNYSLINRAEIYAFFVIKDGAYVVAVKNSRKDADIVKIQLEQIFAGGFN